MEEVIKPFQQLKMSSEFDVTVSFLQDVYKQASLDSQKLTADIKHLRAQFDQMQKNIESRTESIMRQINPRIQQLEEKMRHSWGSIETMDKSAWQDLEREKAIFQNCQQIVQEMDSRIDEVSHLV